jgi:hypothetical protein
MHRHDIRARFFDSDRYAPRLNQEEFIGLLSLLGQQLPGRRCEWFGPRRQNHLMPFA